MPTFSVNLNKVALIRNSRGTNQPDLIQFARRAIECGADGITIHPRPDQRHARYEDIPRLKECMKKYEKKELNIEGYPSKTFLTHVLTYKPDQVTFVPDPPEALTSSFGWDVKKHVKLLKESIMDCHEKGIRTSVFMEASWREWERVKEIHTDRVELYTGPYAQLYKKNPTEAIRPYVNSEKDITKLGIEINAGHDLNQENLYYFLDTIPNIQEVSIGHAVICEALVDGWENTIKRYVRAVLKKSPDQKINASKQGVK